MYQLLWLCWPTPLLPQWQWVVPLEDTHVKEREAAKFECELSIANVNITWQVKGEEIEPSPKYAVTSDGKKHTLLISKCRPKDAGPVSCAYGDIVTEANLTVERQCSLFFFSSSSFVCLWLKKAAL